MSFHELARHATMILPIEHKRNRCFVRVLSITLRMATQSLVVKGR